MYMLLSVSTDKLFPLCCRHIPKPFDFSDHSFDLRGIYITVFITKYKEQIHTGNIPIVSLSPTMPPTLELPTTVTESDTVQPLM